MKATFLYALRRHRLGMIGWALALFGVSLVVLNAYTSFMVDAAETIEELLESMPAGLVKFANLEEVMSPKGFLDARFFLMMPLLLGIYAAIAGSGLLIQDEESGRLDLLMAHPVSRRSVFFGRLAALLVVFCGIIAGGWLGMTVGVLTLGVNLSPLALALPFLCLLAVVTLTASLALLLSLVLPARRFAAIAAIVVLAASFFLSGFARVNESLEPLAKMLPLHYYQGAAAMDQFNGVWFAGYILATAILIGLAYWRFERRDIRVAGESVMPWRKFAVGLAAALVVVVVPVVVALRPKTYSTPEAAFEAAVTAMEQEDWETFALCLSPEAADDWTAHFVVYGAMFQRREKALPQQPMATPGQEVSMDQMMAYFQMLGKFRSAMRSVDAEGLKEHEADVNRAMLTAMFAREAVVLDDGQRDLARLVKDQKKFLNKSLRAWSVAFQHATRPTLEGVEIQGDTARGTMTLQDGSRREIAFRKADGGWRVRLPFLPGEPREAKSSPGKRRKL